MYNFIYVRKLVEDGSRYCFLNFTTAEAVASLIDRFDKKHWNTVSESCISQELVVQVCTVLCHLVPALCTGDIVFQVIACSKMVFDVAELMVVFP